LSEPQSDKAIWFSLRENRSKLDIDRNRRAEHILERFIRGAVIGGVVVAVVLVVGIVLRPHLTCPNAKPLCQSSECPILSDSSCGTGTPAKTCGARRTARLCVHL